MAHAPILTTPQLSSTPPANGTRVARYTTRESRPYPQAIAVDNSGNVYVQERPCAGTDLDYATIRYNASGHGQWVPDTTEPGHGGDYAVALVVNSLGNVYVTGTSASETSASDYVTIKYNRAGQQQWVARYDYSDDVAKAIAMDASGNVYVTGASVPSGGYVNYDYATVKYNPAGAEWVGCPLRRPLEQC